MTEAKVTSVAITVATNMDENVPVRVSDIVPTVVLAGVPQAQITAVAVCVLRNPLSKHAFRVIWVG
jgi:hypothetical protein